jgi:hypothetical protein
MTTEQSKNAYLDLVVVGRLFHDPGRYQPSKSISRPVEICIKSMLESPELVERLDIVSDMAGALEEWYERYHKTNSSSAVSTEIRKFAQIFYHEIFLRKCQGQRHLLQKEASIIAGAYALCYNDNFINQRQQTEKYRKQQQESQAEPPTNTAGSLDEWLGRL